MSATPTRENNPAFRVLGAISVSHMLNDTVQSLILAIYPLLKSDFHLSFSQIGLTTFTYQLTASLLQPVVGHYTDRHPQPYSLPVGMMFSLCGLLLLAFAPNFATLLCAAALMGMGSSIFHPESSRVARMASGGRHGMAQSVFQVGGNFGTSIGPLLAAAFIVPHGRPAVAWFSLLALLAMAILFKISGWYKRHHLRILGKKNPQAPLHQLPRQQVRWILGILLVLIFSKYFYMASISSYFTFYLIGKFHLSVQSAQIHLFVFLFSVAIGTIVGGPLGDKIGRKYVIWFSILGVAPFTLALPYANLFWTGVLTVIIGVILASAFSAILVYAQELIPGKIGMISGLFFGFSFGMGGLGAALLGVLADATSISFVYRVCAFLPLIGLLAAFLPNIKHKPSAA